MNNLIFKTILSLLIVGVVFSCTNSDLDISTDNLRNTKSINFLKYGDYNPHELGIFHNEVLELFMKENSNYNFRTFEELIIDLKVTGKRIYPFKYQNIIDIDYILTLKDDKTLSFYEMIKQTYHGNVSSDVEKVLDYIAVNQLSYAKTHEYIKKNITENNLRNSEKQFLETFDTFASYSNQYWDNFNKKNTKRITGLKGCSPRSQQYIADAFGLLIGGPWGAIGYSFIVHVLQDGGAHCL